MSSPPVDLKIEVKGRPETLRWLTEGKTRIFKKLVAAMHESGRELRDAVRAGSQQFREHSGKLRRAIYFRVREKGDLVFLRAGVAGRAFYAYMLEHGVAASDFDVRPHVRRTKSGTKYRTEAGRTTKTRTQVKFTETQTGITFVKGHKRSMRMAARPFVTPAYNRLKARIEGRINAAIRTGGGGGDS